MKKHINPARHNAVITHGTFMGFAFAFLFPLGAIIIRIASFRGLVWVHAGIQAFSYLLALIGLALGVYIAIYPESQVSTFNLIVFSLHYEETDILICPSSKPVTATQSLESSLLVALCSSLSVASYTITFTRSMESEPFGPPRTSGGAASL